MNMRHGLKRLLCLGLAVLMVLSLAACGGRAPEQIEVAPVRVNQELAGESVISRHISNNEAMRAWNPEIKRANELNFYIASTETMEGFVNCDTVSQFQKAVEGIFDVSDSQYDTSSAYLMEGSGSSLQWVRQEMDDYLLRALQSGDVYRGKTLPDTGSLNALFQQVEEPFPEYGLSVVVSNFVEPGFNLNALAVGIEKYFAAYTDSAACVIGFHSNFKGRFHIPQHNNNVDRTTYYLENFSGEVPCYIVLVGPEQSVLDFSDSLFQELDTREVEYSSTMVCDNIFEERMIPLLTFEPIADYEAKRAPASTMSSYNTGDYTQTPGGDAFQAKFEGVTTTSEYTSGAEDVNVTKSTQISIISSGYDGATRYDQVMGWKLYELNEATGQWMEASRNAEKKVNVAFNLETGELGEELNNNYFTILAPGRKEIRVSVRLDYSDDNILSRSKTYRVELSLRLDEALENPRSFLNNEYLVEDYGITSSRYYSLAQKMKDAKCTLQFGNFTWSGAGEDRLQDWDARNLLRRTPELEAFLNRLADLETCQKETPEQYQYVDFVFAASQVAARGEEADTQGEDSGSRGEASTGRGGRG